MTKCLQLDYDFLFGVDIGWENVKLNFSIVTVHGTLDLWSYIKPVNTHVGRQ